MANLTEFFEKNPLSLIELAVSNNFAAVRNQAVFFYPQMVDQTADFDDIINLIETLLAQGDISGVQSILQAPINWGTLSTDERDAVLAFGGVNKVQQYRSTGESTGAATDFNWDAIIAGASSIITGAFAAFGGGGNTAPIVQQAPAAAPATDFTPIVTAAKWIVGGLIVGGILWAVVSIIKASKAAK